jgi:hypothetical protein
MADAPASRLFTVQGWVETHAWPPIGGLRHLIFHANENGFHTVVRRVGRRVLLDEAAFEDWVRSQQSPVPQPGRRGPPR